MDEPELNVVRVPMLDTGIGRMGGYANDIELIDAFERERAALSAWQRQMLDELMHREVVAFVNGV